MIKLNMQLDIGFGDIIHLKDAPIVSRVPTQGQFQLQTARRPKSSTSKIEIRKVSAMESVNFAPKRLYHYSIPIVVL